MGEHVPKFGTRQQEADFWEKTGVDQLAPDQLEEVAVRRPERPLSTTFAVRFDQRTVELIRQIARAHALGPTQLVRAWVLERLRIEESVGILAQPISQFPSDFEVALRKKIVDALFSRIPAAAEEALQEVLDRADQEAAALHRDALEKCTSPPPTLM